MSDKKYNRNSNEPSDDFYLNETIGPEHYRRFTNEQINQNQAQPQQNAQQAPNRASHPLFADDGDVIPAYNLGDDSSDGYDDVYSNSDRGIYISKPQQPQAPQYQPPLYRQPVQRQAPPRQPFRQPQPYPAQQQHRQTQQKQQPAPLPKKKQGKETEKKKHTLLKALIITPLVLMLTVGIILGAVAVGMISKIDYNQVDLEQNKYINSAELHSSKDVINILFVGIDDDEGGNSRSDSMMLVSVDKKHKKIKLASFLRDSWVELPMKGKKAKLNAAYSANGIQGAVDTIEYNFRVDIDHYVMVDFEMFTKIIDAVGGVEVEVTEKEAKFIRQTTRFKNMQSGEKVRLNGAEALVYCRIRKLDSDYMRTYRQRKVISALIEQAKSADIKTLIDAMYEVFPLLQTDLSKTEVLSVGAQAGYGLLSYEIEQTRVPIEEHMSVDTINGQWVEVLDLEKVREYIYDFLYTDKIKFDEDKKEN